MRVKCTGVSYYERGQSNPQGEPVNVPAATVSFTFGTQSDEGNSIEQFSLSFINLDTALDYFPGEEYELELTPVTNPD